MKAILIATALVVMTYAFHRLALSAEKRGWIHYTKAGRSSASLSNAFGEIQSIIEPSKRYVVEQRAEPRVEEDDAGGPPRAGTDRPSPL